LSHNREDRDKEEDNCRWSGFPGTQIWQEEKYPGPLITGLAKHPFTVETGHVSLATDRMTIGEKTLVYIQLGYV